MRIGIEAQRIFRKKKHGMDMVALELIRALQKLDCEHEFFVFVNETEDSACLKPSKNVQVIALPAAPYPIWEQWHLPKAVKEYKIDLLHCTSNTAPLFLSVPLVLTLHDIIYLEKINLSEGTSYQKFGNLYRRWNVPRIVRKAKTILTVSDFENVRIREYFGFGSDRVITAYNGAGDHFKRVTDMLALSQTREKYNLPDNFIFFLGNTDPKKNVAGVIKALSILKQRGTLPCKLLMLDINREYLSALANSIGDPDILEHISFSGYVPNTELPAIYSLATMFLYPSLRESFGIPLVEAMKCGVPVITSNTSSMPEIVQDAGLICDPFKPETIADAITNLWNNDQLKQTLIEKGKQRAISFSWEANARQTLAIYETTFNSTRYQH